LLDFLGKGLLFFDIEGQKIKGRLGPYGEEGEIKKSS
jgi:hypothetical protein